MLSPPNACLIIAVVSVSLSSKICTKFYAVSLSDPSRNRVRPDTGPQIQGRKNQNAHPAARNFVHWIPRYAL
jgi:hypothetical protein